MHFFFMWWARFCPNFYLRRQVLDRVWLWDRVYRDFDLKSGHTLSGLHRANVEMTRERVGLWQNECIEIALGGANVFQNL